MARGLLLIDMICGTMSHMCIDASTRVGFELGLRRSVADDACATRALNYGGFPIKAREVRGAFMAAIGSIYAQLAHTRDLPQR